MSIKKLLCFVLIFLIIFIFISAWPFFLILFVIAWMIPAARKKSKYQNIYLMLSSILLAVALGEITFRIIGNDQSYEERTKMPLYHILLPSYPSPFAPEETGWLHIHEPTFHERQQRREYAEDAWQPNNESLHDRNWPLNKTGKYRVLLIGDSFTEGLGSTNDSSLSVLLARDNDTLEVMNAGVSGSDPVFELRLMEMRLFKYHPDAVIMSINQSDISDLITRGGMERFRPDSTVRYRPAPWWEPLYACSYIVRSYVNGVCKLDCNYMSAAEEKRLHSLVLGQLQDVIVLASKECRERNIRFVADFHPVPSEVAHDSMECTPVMVGVQKKGVETFNMLSYYEHHGIDSLHVYQYYWQFDGHHNNKGYATMAQGLSTLFR